MSQERKESAKIILPKTDDVDGTKNYFYLQKFFRAADRSEYENVLECLRSGISINSYDMIGRTVFHIAAANGDLHLIKLLINWPDRDLNMQTFDFQMTPLQEAVVTERTDIISIFLKSGAMLNTTTGNGETAVHMAVKLNSVVILKILISYKANLNIVDVFSNTPLSLAILGTKNQVISGLLLRHGARVNKSRPNAMYLFHEAVLDCIKREYMAFLKLLVKYGAFVNYVDVYGRNALHYAAIAGIPFVVQYLLEIGVKATIEDKTSRTPYDIAVAHGHVGVIKILTVYLRILGYAPNMITAN